jgi:hypothetical protein
MNVTLERIDSRSELQECLRKAGHSILLGGEDEGTKEFFVAAMAPCSIGICSQGHGPKPANLLDEANGGVWFGYNSNIASIDLCKCCPRFRVTLDGVFFTILGQMGDGSVIVIHELGACRINRSGDVLWSFTTDVVLDFADGGDVVHVRTEEGETRIEKDRGVALR